MKRRTTFWIYIFLMMAGLVMNAPQLKAQEHGNIEESLAATYYQKGEFDKAGMLYKKLLDANPGNTFYYDSYLNCLLNLKDYKTAEKELSRLIKKSGKASLFYKVDLGYVYKLDGDEKKSDKEFDDIIDNMVADQTRIEATAAAFSRRDLNEYMIKTYTEGRNILHDNNVFSLPLAMLYKAQKDYQSMFNEYMAMLDANPYDFESVRNYIQDAVMQDEAYEIFRKILLKRAQATPDNIAYNEMLNWLYIQRKDFNSAFIQSKAIDKRLHEGGHRIIDLARIVVDYQDYDLAERMYQYVVDLGNSTPYFVMARRGLLDIRYARITNSANYTQADVDVLTKDYNEFLDTYGLLRTESGEIILRLSEIMAQYNKNVDGAIKLLKTYIGQNGPDNIMIARAKLALADYLLIADNVWDATLYYSQVEKMYSDAPLGHEAKFRNAKLSFYRGDFDWAKAQLDVLKSSTTELIANDAMQLSLLIQENTGLDSIVKPLRLYAEADLYIFKNMYAEATVKLDSITRQYPKHSLADEVLMARATIAFKKRDYAAALGYYEKVYTEFSKDVLADDALYQAAVLNEKFLNNKDLAKVLYQKLILEYPGSVYAVEATDHYRKLRGDNIN